MNKPHWRARRKGLTLVETVVSLTLTAAMAAVVIPEVMQHADDSDPARIAADVTSIRQGVTAFYLDVIEVPGDVEDLSSQITTSDYRITKTDTSRYSAADSSRWQGPYTTLSTAADDNPISTGFNATIRSKFRRFNATTNTWATSNEVLNIGATDEVWTAVLITGIKGEDFELTNDVIDGVAETDGGNAGQSQLAGRFRFKSDTAVYLLAQY